MVLTICSQFFGCGIAVCEFLTELFVRILQTNYSLFNSLLYALATIATSAITCVSTIFSASVNLCLSVQDFAVEFSNCFAAVFVVLWRVVSFGWKMVSTIASGLDSISWWIINSATSFLWFIFGFVTDGSSTCTVTAKNLSTLIYDICALVLHAFTTIGAVIETLFINIFSGVYALFGLIVSLFWSVREYINDIIDKLDFNIRSIFTHHLYNLPRETYLGILFGVALYIFIPNAIKFLHNRGLTFPIYTRSRRRHPGHLDPRVHARHDIELSDMEDLAEEYDEFENESSEHSNSESDSGEASPASTEFSDEESGAASDVSDVDSVSTQESITVDLPKVPRYNTRSSTPARGYDIRTEEEYAREIEEERDKRKCVVCQDQNKNVLLLPCKHMCLCVECASQIVKSRLAYRRVCPLCRRRIQTVMNVFV